MVNRVVFGALGGGQYGLRVSRPGYDVGSSLGIRQLAFDSRWLEGLSLFSHGYVAGPSPRYIYFGTTFSSPPIVLGIRYNGGSYYVNPNLQATTTYLHIGDMNYGYELTYYWIFRNSYG